MDEQSMTVRFPKELHRRLRRAAFDSEISMNAIVVRAVEDAIGDKGPLAAIRELLRHFDWEHHDRQLALEEIGRIVNGSAR